MLVEAIAIAGSIIRQATIDFDDPPQKAT